MIDLHSHILPGVDDGPADLEGSILLAQAAVAGGTRTIAATPHIEFDFGVDPLAVAGWVADLQAQLRERAIALEVVTGGEIALSRLADLSEEELLALRLGGGPFLLVESPFSPSVGDFGPILLDLISRGHGVLLAHPERSPAFLRHPGRLREMVDAGVLVQITASSLAGDFGTAPRRFALELLREGLVHVVASDAHDHISRSPSLAAVERVAPGLEDHLTRAVPAAILYGEPLPDAPDYAPLGFWRRLVRGV